MEEDEEKGKGSPETTNKKSNLRHNSPLVQVLLIGLVCFCCPGMYNALTGLGGAGQVDPTAANNANTAIYTLFAIFSILGGGIYNILGPHLTLFTGCSTYVLYAASFLYYNHYKHQAFAIVAGALLGVGAALLWSAQGAIMTSYPPHHRKGIYISMFWGIFNMGGLIGGLIPFMSNFHRNDAVSVKDGTYIGFMIFMSIGTILTLGICHPSSVIRDDGTRCTNIKFSSVRVESREIAKLLSNWKVLLMVPAFWASNFIHSYQFNNVNGILFNLRTRGLNNVLYWSAQIVGSALIGYVFDFSFKNRRTRGLVGIGVVAAFGTAVWGGGLANQLGYSRDHQPAHKLDFKDGWSFAGPFLLYFSYGAHDAMFHNMVFWVIGALADESEILSRYTGLFHGVESAGAAVAWQIDTKKVPFLNELIANLALTKISYPLLAVVVLLAVKDDKINAPETVSALDSTTSATNFLVRESI